MAEKKAKKAAEAAEEARKKAAGEESDELDDDDFWGTGTADKKEDGDGELDTMLATNKLAPMLERKDAAVTPCFTLARTTEPNHPDLTSSALLASP